MLVESAAIVVLIGLMSIILLRAKKPGWALAVLPLGLLPLLHLVSYSLSLLLTEAVVDGDTLMVVVDVIAIVAAICLFLFLQKNMKARRAKVIYVLCSTGFAILMGSIFICNIVLF